MTGSNFKPIRNEKDYIGAYSRLLEDDILSRTKDSRTNAGFAVSLQKSSPNHLLVVFFFSYTDLRN